MLMYEAPMDVVFKVRSYSMSKGRVDMVMFENTPAE
jgi:hypothetical protein